MVDTPLQNSAVTWVTLHAGWDNPGSIVGPGIERTPGPVGVAVAVAVVGEGPFDDVRTGCHAGSLAFRATSVSSEPSGRIVYTSGPAGVDRSKTMSSPSGDHAGFWSPCDPSVRATGVALA